MKLLPKIVRRLLIVAGVFIGLALLLFLAIQTPFAKRHIAAYTTDYLRERFDLRVQLESLDYRFSRPLQIKLSGLRIYGGPAGKSLFLQSRSIDAKIPYSSLWGDSFIIESLLLDTPSIEPENLPKLKSTEDRKESSTLQIRQFSITGGALRYSQFKLRELRMNAVLEPDSVQLKQLWARLENLEMEAQGQLTHFKDPKYTITYTAKGNADTISRLFPQSPPLDGVVHTKGMIHGAVGYYAVQGSLQSDQLSVHRDRSLAAKGTYKIDSRDTTSPYWINLHFTSLPLSVLRKFSSQIPPISTAAAGSISYHGSQNIWQGTGAFDLRMSPTPAKGTPLLGSVNGVLAGGSIQVERADLRWGSSDIEFTGSLNPIQMNVKLRAGISNPSTLATFVPDLRKIPAAAYEVDATLRGPYTNLMVSWRLAGAGSDLKLNSSGSYLTGSRQVRAEVQGQISGKALNRLYPEDISGTIRFSGTATGFIRNPVLQARIQGDSLRFRTTELGDANIQLNSDGKVLNATAELPQFSTTAEGSYYFLSQKYQLQARFADLTLDQLKPFLPQTAEGVSGSATGTLNASGNIRRWRSSDADLYLQEASFARQEARFQVESGSVIRVRQQVASVDLHVRMNEGNLDVRGVVPLARGKKMELRAIGNIGLQIVSLFTNEIEGKGTIGLEVAVTGTPQRPQFSGEITSEDFQFSMPAQRINISKGRLLANVYNSKISLQTSVLLNGSPIRAEGTLPLIKAHPMDIRVTGESNLNLLANFTTQLQGDGPVTMDIRIRGTPVEPQFAGKISAQQFSLSTPKVSLTRASGLAELSGTEIRLKANGLLNGSVLDLDGVVPLKENPGSIHLSLSSFPLSTLATSSDVSGAVTLKLEANGFGRKLTNWTAYVEATPENLRLGERSIAFSEPVRIQLAKGLAELKPLHLKGNLLNVEAQAKVNFDAGQIEARIRSEAEMSLLRALFSDVQTSGQMSANLQVSGKLNDPSFTGEVRIRNGFLRIPESPIFLEKIDLVAPVQQDKITIRTLTAAMGGGTIRGEGQIELRNWSPGPASLKIKAERIGFRYPEDVRSQVNADLDLSGEQNYLLSGKIQILRSSYREDIDPRQRLVNSLLSEKHALAMQPSAGARLRLNLEVRTLEDFQLRNNMGKLQAAANLQITGSVADPRISGRIQVREGSEILFEGNQFEVRRGVVDFYGQRKIDPVFDLELFTIAQDVDTKQEYDITLPLSGALSNLDDRDPTSFPPLSPDQIYFLLLTGRADAQLSRASSRFFQQQMASYVSGQVFSDVQKKVAQAFGLQRVEIQPEVISSETTPGAKMVLGKDFSSSLSLAYSISLKESKEQTWIASYRATRNLTFRFVDQEDGTYTTNVRHFVRFGAGVPAKSLRRPHKPIKRRITKMQITNQSVLTEDEVRKIIGKQTGDLYDFWEIQDRLDQVEQELQQRGFLFSRAEMEERALGRDSIQVEIEVSGGEKRRMEFSGATITKAQNEKFLQFWREGFSEQAVLELIGDDVLRRMQFLGHHKAEVIKESKKENANVVYHFQVNPGPKYANATLLLQGAKLYPAEDLEQDLKNLYGDRPELMTEALHNFDSFRRKIAALYMQRGFLDAKVESGSTRFQGQTVEKQILISEGSPSRVTEVRIANGHRFPEDLRRSLKLQAGSIYDRQALQEDELAITEDYEKRGYRKIELETETKRIPKTDDLILKYELRTGGVARVNSIRITGNHRTSRKLIEKRIDLKPGEILNQEKLSNAQKSLTDLRIFHRVTVRAQETDVPDLYDVVAEVIEIKHYELTYGIRYDTEKGIGGEVQLVDLSLFGSGHGLSLYTRVNRANQLFRTVYHSPTVAGLNWNTLVSASYETGELLLRETNQLGLAEGQRYGPTLQKQYRLWDPFVLIGNYEFEVLKIRPISSPDQPFDSFKISTLGATLLADTRDDPLNATRGGFLSLDFRLAPAFLPTDATFVKGYAQYFQFKPLGKMLWASTVRLGVASELGDRLITERFLAGGAFTIRGFRKDQVGPKDALGNPIGGEAVFMINQELRFPLWKWFGGAVFYDAGNVYDSIGNFNPLRLRHSFGFGLRVNSPFGIARIDLGINPRRQGNEPSTVLHFGIGQAF